MGGMGQRPRSGHGGCQASRVWWISTGAPATGWEAASVTRRITGARGAVDGMDWPAPLTMMSCHWLGSTAVAVKVVQMVVQAQAESVAWVPEARGPVFAWVWAVLWASGVELDRAMRMGPVVGLQVTGPPMVEAELSTSVTCGVQRTVAPSA